MKFSKILLLFIFLLPLKVLAVGVAVNPSELQIVLPGDNQTTLQITNISDEPVMVFVSPDDFVDNIIIDPAEIQLLPEQATQIRITTNFANTSAGVKKSNISVITQAVDKRSFNASSGIKIPLTINIAKSYWQWSGEAVFVLVFLSLFALFFIIWLIIKFIKKKKAVIN
jgi:hypothetical protein